MESYRDRFDFGDKFNETQNDSTRSRFDDTMKEVDTSKYDDVSTKATSKKTGMWILKSLLGLMLLAALGIAIAALVLAQEAKDGNKGDIPDDEFTNGELVTLHDLAENTEVIDGILGAKGFTDDFSLVGRVVTGSSSFTATGGTVLSNVNISSEYSVSTASGDVNVTVAGAGVTVSSDTSSATLTQHGLTAGEMTLGPYGFVLPDGFDDKTASAGFAPVTIWSSQSSVIGGSLNDAKDQIIVTFDVPANTMRLGDTLRFSATGQKLTANDDVNLNIHIEDDTNAVNLYADLNFGVFDSKVNTIWNMEGELSFQTDTSRMLATSATYFPQNSDDSLSRAYSDYTTGNELDPAKVWTVSFTWEDGTSIASQATLMKASATYVPRAPLMQTFGPLI